MSICRHCPQQLRLRSRQSPCRASVVRAPARAHPASRTPGTSPHHSSKLLVHHPPPSPAAAPTRDCTPCSTTLPIADPDAPIEAASTPSPQSPAAKLPPRYPAHATQTTSPSPDPMLAPRQTAPAASPQTQPTAQPHCRPAEHPTESQLQEQAPSPFPEPIPFCARRSIAGFNHKSHGLSQDPFHKPKRFRVSVCQLPVPHDKSAMFLARLPFDSHTAYPTPHRHQMDFSAHPDIVLRVKVRRTPGRANAPESAPNHERSLRPTRLRRPAPRPRHAARSSTLVVAVLASHFGPARVVPNW